MTSATMVIAPLRNWFHSAGTPPGVITLTTGWSVSTPGGVPEDVVGAGRLLCPVRLVRGEGLHPAQRVGDVPALVGVHVDAYAGADGVAGRLHPPDVVLEVPTDLQLDLAEAVGDGLLGQPDQFLVGVAEPAGRGGVALLAQSRRPSGPAAFGGAQDGRCLLGGEEIGQIAEVDERDGLLGVSSRRGTATPAVRRGWPPGLTRR
jgi:hypothetical protein